LHYYDLKLCSYIPPADFYFHHYCTLFIKGPGLVCPGACRFFCRFYLGQVIKTMPAPSNRIGELQLHVAPGTYFVTTVTSGGQQQGKLLVE
jgi:hypothetical protein